MGLPTAGTWNEILRSKAGKPEAKNNCMRDPNRKEILGIVASREFLVKLFFLIEKRSS